MAKKSDGEKNAYNTNAIDRARFADAALRMLKNWNDEDGIPTLKKVADRLGLKREFLRNIISDEAIRLIDSRQKPNPNLRPPCIWYGSEYLSYFPAGKKRGHGNRPSADEIAGAFDEAVKLAPDGGMINAVVLARMLGSNQKYVIEAMSADTRSAIEGWNAAKKEEGLWESKSAALRKRKWGKCGSSDYPIIANWLTVGLGVNAKAILGAWSEYVVELSQQESGCGYDALLGVPKRYGFGYERKYFFKAVRSLEIDAADHNSRAEGARLMTAELIYVFVKEGEVAGVVRKAQWLVPETGADTLTLEIEE